MGPRRGAKDKITLVHTVLSTMAAYVYIYRERERVPLDHPS